MGDVSGPIRLPVWFLVAYRDVGTGFKAFL